MSWWDPAPSLALPPSRAWNWPPHPARGLGTKQEPGRSSGAGAPQGSGLCGFWETLPVLPGGSSVHRSYRLVSSQARTPSGRPPNVWGTQPAVGRVAGVGRQLLSPSQAAEVREVLVPLSRACPPGSPMGGSPGLFPPFMPAASGSRAGRRGRPGFHVTPPPPTRLGRNPECAAPTLRGPSPGPADHFLLAELVLGEVRGVQTAP